MHPTLSMLQDFSNDIHQTLFSTMPGARERVFSVLPLLIKDPLGIGRHVLDPRLGRAACLLAALERGEKSVESSLTALKALAGLGPLGWSAAVASIRKKKPPLHEILAWPDLQSLFLVHQMGKHDFIGERRLMQLMEPLLQKIPKTRPSALLDFAATLGVLRERPHFLLRRALRESELPGWIRKKLTCEHSDLELFSMVRAILALPDKELILPLMSAIPPQKLALLPETEHLLGSPRGETDAKVLEYLAKALDSDLPQDAAAACLRAVTALKDSRTANIMALLSRRRPKLASTATALYPMLGAETCLDLMDASKDCGRLCAKAMAKALALEPGTLSRDLLNRAPAAVAETVQAAVAQAAQELEPSGNVKPAGKGSLLPTVLGLRRDLRKALERPGPTILRSGILKNHTLKGRTISCLQAPEALIRGSSLENVRLTDCDLHQAVFADTRFNHCVFSRVFAGQAKFTNCSFAHCRLESTDLSRTEFTACRFTDCVLDMADMTDTVMHGCEFKGVEFSFVHFAEAVIRHCRFLSCGLRDTDASDLSIDNSFLRGVDMRRSMLSRAVFHKCTAMPMQVEDCSLAEARIRHTQSDAAPLLACARSTLLFDLTDSRADMEADMEKALLDAGPKWCRQAAEEWISLREMAATMQTMLDFNQQRLRRAKTRMQPEQASFLRSIPLFLGSGVMEKILGQDLRIQAWVRGHVPGLDERRWVASLAGEAVDADVQGTDLSVASIFSMGSMGSIAQTSESDVDCWICLTRPCKEKERSDLEQKLTDLARWAEEKTGLEIHFFPMTLQGIAANQFGEAGDESSGSAQSFLLKEEFYRTGLRLAGAMPLWWCTPPQTSQKSYASAGGQADRLPGLGPGLIADFGYPAKVPAQEFLGACLWQMVKGMAGPFKSVIKLGLLQKYALESTDHPADLLCERLKASLLSGQNAAENVDPYCLLYAVLQDYFHNDDKALNLLQAAFINKAGLCKIPMFMGRPATFLDTSCLRFFLNQEDVEEKDVSALNQPVNLTKILKLGREINEFMLRIYRNIQGRIPAGAPTEGLGAAPRDMLWLSRTIFAVYSRQSSEKIERIPFFHRQPPRVDELILACHQNTGQKKWAVLGRLEKATPVELTAGRELPALGTWLILNNFFRPEIIVHSQGSVSPLSLPDFNALLRHLWTFLAAERAMETASDAFFQPDQVRRAMVIINLCVPLEEPSVRQIHVVYATTWGEVFCTALDAGTQGFLANPSDTLRENLPHPVHEDVEIQLFIPSKSKAPRPQLPRTV